MISKASQPRPFRWTMKKGLLALFLFSIAAALVECLIVIYVASLGVKDESYLQSSLTFPGSDWTLVIGVSPLFHLVPMSIIAVLATSWISLARHLSFQTTKRSESFDKRRHRQNRQSAGRSILSKINIFSYTREKFQSARPTLRSALILFAVFLLLSMSVSLLTYPKLIYQAVSNAYQNSPALLDFIRGTGQSLASIGSFFSGVNNALLESAPGIRDLFSVLGGTIGPLAGLDGAGKYLFLQNAAAWISAFFVLLYGEYKRSRRHAKR